MTGRSARVGLAAIVIAGVFLGVGAPPAAAAIASSFSLTVPTTTTVGATGLAVQMTVINQNSAPNQAEHNNVTSIKVAPSCGTTASFGSVCSGPDPGSFVVSNGVGGAGTVCAGLTFTASAADASGIVTYTPSGPINLAPPGSATGTDRCTMSLNMNTVKVPGFDVDAALPGLQTWFTARFDYVTSLSMFPTHTSASAKVTVNPAQPTITAQAVPTTSFGSQPVRANATVQGPISVASPTGTVVFTVHGPPDTDCTGPPLFMETAVLIPGAGGQSTTNSHDFIPEFPGTYRWKAEYSGDGNQRDASTTCGAPGTVVEVEQASAPSDFNGDGTVDLALYRPGNRTWYIRNQATIPFGAAGDIPVPADYNGDGTTDIAVFRPDAGTWHVRGLFTMAYGAEGDIPVPADYTGDGAADLAVFRPATGTWHVRTLATVKHGSMGDIPVPADYTGDGITDLAVFRPAGGTWHVRGMATIQYGTNGDKPVPADYNGNGTIDLAVFRPGNGTWYVRNVATTKFGSAGDIPVPADHNGTGGVDLAVFRPATGTWHRQGMATIQYGTNGDIPTLRRPA